MSSRDIHCRVEWGEVRITMVAEGVSWSPEVAEDLMTRCLRGFGEALALLEGDDAEDTEDTET